jgi:hypothetical protein
MAASKTNTAFAGGQAKTGPGALHAAFGRQLSLASRSVHADDFTNAHPAVAPPMHVSTTFRYSENPDELVPWSDTDVSSCAGTVSALDID